MTWRGGVNGQRLTAGPAAFFLSSLTPCLPPRDSKQGRRGRGVAGDGPSGSGQLRRGRGYRRARREVPRPGEATGAAGIDRGDRGGRWQWRTSATGPANSDRPRRSWDRRRTRDELPHPSRGRTGVGEERSKGGSRWPKGGGGGRPWARGQGHSGVVERGGGGAMGSGWSSGEVRREGKGSAHRNLAGGRRWPRRQWAARRSSGAQWSGWGGSCERGGAGGCSERLRAGLFIAGTGEAITTATAAILAAYWSTEAMAQAGARRRRAADLTSIQDDAMARGGRGQGGR